MAEPDQNSEPDKRIVAHIGHVAEDVPLEDIHLERLRRERRRRNLQWMAIVLAASLLAAALFLLLSGFSADFPTAVPGYEPKDQSRQQPMEQSERGRQKEAP